MIPTPINIKDKLSTFSEHWCPKIIARMNDIDFKLCKFQGDFIWHKHEETDEVFIVLDGVMHIDFRDGSVDINTGEMIVVPKGVEHKPSALDECRIMTIEPIGTVNTGDAGGNRTSPVDAWI